MLSIPLDEIFCSQKNRPALSRENFLFSKKWSLSKPSPKKINLTKIKSDVSNPSTSHHPKKNNFGKLFKQNFHHPKKLNLTKIKLDAFDPLR